MVAALEETVPRCNEDAARIQQEISTLQSKKQFIISNPTVLGSKSCFIFNIIKYLIILALQSNITKPEKKIKHKANRIQEDSDVDISEGINFVINKRLAACWAEDACTHMYGEHSVKCKNNERMHIIESIICFPAPKVVSLEEKENDKRIQYQLPNTRSLFPSWCNNA